MNGAATIRCPRCGYELRGVVASWSDACPLTGRCTECGLAFEWAGLVCPSRRLPAWCVEYAPQWWSLPGRSLKTLLMMLRPWRFWSELRMTHAPRWGRVMAVFVLVIFLLYLQFALTVGAGVLRDARPRPVPAAPVAFSAFYAVVLPLSSDPPSPYIAGMAPPIRFARRFVPRVGSIEDTCFAMLTGKWRWGASFGSSLVLAAVGCSTIVTSSLGFMALPASRRRARVMWWHVHRITLYSGVLVGVVLAVDFAWYAGRINGWPIPRTSAVEIWYAVLIGVPILLVVWWYFAVKRYLRMPHALGVAVALVTIGLLLGPALIIVLLVASAGIL